MTSVLFIHGRSQEGKNPDKLRDTWRKAMLAGLENLGLSAPPAITYKLPFYGDRLKELVDGKQKNDPQVLHKGVLADGSQQQLDFTFEILLEVAKAKGVTVGQVEQEVGMDVVTEKGIQNWPGVLALLKLIDKVDGVGDFSVSIATADVWQYLTDSATNKIIQKMVQPDFDAAAGPTVVVSHSLGTMVAFNALNALENRSHIKAWITLGSPLGIKAIYSRLPSTLPPRRAPVGVPMWLNARDPLDTVALYDIAPASYSGDPIVQNYSQVANTSDNHHGIESYLKDPKVAAFIHSYL
jgi:hypothetical protein